MEQTTILFFQIAPFDILTNSPEKLTVCVVVWCRTVWWCNGAIQTSKNLVYDFNSQVQLYIQYIQFLSVSLYRLLFFPVWISFSTWLGGASSLFFCMSFYLFPVFVFVYYIVLAHFASFKTYYSCLFFSQWPKWINEMKKKIHKSNDCIYISSFYTLKFKLQATHHFDSNHFNFDVSERKCEMELVHFTYKREKKQILTHKRIK